MLEQSKLFLSPNPTFFIAYFRGFLHSRSTKYYKHSGLKTGLLFLIFILLLGKKIDESYIIAQTVEPFFVVTF
jgi:hypothetical protein